jgi:transposase
MPPHIPQALKDRVPVLFHEQDMTVTAICKVLGLRKSTAYSTLAFHKKYGASSKPSFRRRRRILTLADTTYICSLLDQKPTLYLDEIQDYLYRQRHVTVSLSTLTRTLRRIDMTNKAISRHAIERNQTLRAAYMNYIGHIITDPLQLMFTDESSIDRRTMVRQKGWTKAGSRCVQRQHFVRGNRYSVLPVLTLDGILTYDIIQGSVTSDRFLAFLSEFVVSLSNTLPVLAAHPELDSLDQSLSRTSQRSRS